MTTFRPFARSQHPLRAGLFDFLPFLTMLFQNRIWCLTEVSSSETLSRMLTQQTWCQCAAFVVTGHDSVLFLNDATGPDGAQEYAVVIRTPQGTLRQVDSITFSWCSTNNAQWLIDQYHEIGSNDTYPGSPIRPHQVETQEQHRRRVCLLCA